MQGLPSSSICSSQETKVIIECLCLYFSLVEHSWFIICGGFTFLGELQTRVVQILSPPFNGKTVLPAGSAQFGADLSQNEMGVSIMKHNLLFGI